MAGEQPYAGPALTGEYRVLAGLRRHTDRHRHGRRRRAGEETVLLLAQVREPADLAALDTALDTLTLSPP